MSRVQLFTLPFAGGSRYAYQELKPHLPAHIDLCPYEYPGRGYRIREPLLRNWRALLADMAAHIRPEGDYALFGHSMGACFAPLLARRLMDAGFPAPRHLFVSGRNGPGWQDPDREAVHLLPRTAFLQRLRDMGGSPDEVLNSSTLMDLYEPILRADFSVLHAYAHPEQAPLEVPVTVLYGTEEADITPEGLQFWQAETVFPVEYKAYPGGHFFLFTHWPQIAAHMATRLKA